MFLLVALLGCQEPFGADRHDLRGFRVAALTASVEEGVVRPRVALIADGRPWSAAPVQLDWAFVDEPGDAVLEPAPVDSGPDVALPVGGARLTLHAHDGDASVWAELDLEARTQLELRIGVERTEQQAAGLGIEELTQEARADWATSPGRSVEPGGFLRLRVEGAPASALGRFMATGDGTWFELDGSVADWAAAEVTVDDEEVAVEPVEAGTYSMVVLSVDATSSGFAATEAHVGPVPDGVWVSGRFLPGTAGSGRQWVTLEADDTAPSGLRIASAEPAGADATWSPTEAGCVGVDGTFDPTWLLTQHCSRDALAGRRVLVEVDP